MNPTVLLFANQATDEAVAHNIGPAVSLELAANEAKPEGVWVQLSPFGSFPNALGKQVVNKDDVDAVVNDYGSFANSGRRVLGLPWYVGHPDHPDFKEFYNDTGAKGRIKSMECRHDAACADCNNFANEEAGAQPCAKHGLFALTKFNDEGRKLIANQSYHGHSVNWRLQRRADGWHPIQLKSVGFTNEPNIPVPAVTAANEKKAPMAKENDPMAAAAAKQPTLMDRVKSLLKLGDGANEDEAYGAMERMSSDHGATMAANADLTAKHAALAKQHGEMCNAFSAISKRFAANEAPAELTKLADGAVATLKAESGLEVPAEGQFTFLANEAKSARATAKTLTTERDAANERATRAETDMANERKSNCDQLSTLLITGGFVTKAEADALAAGKDFTKKADHDAFMANAKSLKPKINVVTGVSLAGARNTTITEKTNLNGELINMANEVMEQRKGKKQKHDWDTCWGLACASPKGKEILAQMKRPDAAGAARQ